MTRPQISHGPLLVSIACARPFGLMSIAPLKLSVRCVEVSWFLLIWSFGFFVHRRGAAAYLRVEWGHSKMNDLDQCQLFERLQLSWQMPFLLIKCYRFPVIRHPQGFVELGAKFRWKWKTCCGWSLHVATFHSSSLSWLGFALSFFVIVIFLHRIFQKLGGWEYLWFA